MSKIMFVEDDSALSEIYSIRLTAEGYAVVTAHDGEEALAVAIKERPDLVISDVMMPKISGFDMLDILRQTPETRNIRVIMMTALSSEQERQRGEQLGADRYLVKSQVGIEDVVNTVHDVLGDRTPAGIIDPASPQPVMPVGAPAPIPGAVPMPDPSQAPVIPSPMAAPQAPPTPIAQPFPQAQPAIPGVAPSPYPAPAAPQPAPEPQFYQQPLAPGAIPSIPQLPINMV